MKTVFIPIVLLLSAPATVRPSEPTVQREVRAHKTNLTREQEIHLGQQAAANAERTMRLVHSPEVEDWLNQVGKRLAGAPQAGDYPYSFKLVEDASPNAVAFPGGIVYVNTGLLAAAGNESEVAGVIAHEMSHVALRHGADKEAHAKQLKMALQVAGIAAGAAGVPLAGPVIGLGGDAGIKAAQGKYSRDTERDADLNGARMMAAAGYNPEALAHLLDKLNESGATTPSKGLGHLGADHPDTAKRSEWIRQDILFYPAKTYDAESGRFPEIRAALVPMPGQAPGSGNQPATKVEVTPTAGQAR
jgi:predicted Zn-dependent protease